MVQSVNDNPGSRNFYIPVCLYYPQCSCPQRLINEGCYASSSYVHSPSQQRFSFTDTANRRINLVWWTKSSIKPKKRVSQPWSLPEVIGEVYLLSHEAVMVKNQQSLSISAPSDDQRCPLLHVTQFEVQTDI